MLRKWAGRHSRALQPVGGASIRLYPSGRGKPSKGFKLGERRVEVPLEATGEG